MERSIMKILMFVALLYEITVAQCYTSDCARYEHYYEATPLVYTIGLYQFH